MVYSEPDEDGSYTGTSREYFGDSLTWSADGVLDVDFKDDIQPSFLGHIPFWGWMDISDGSSETSLQFSFSFNPDINDLEVTDVLIENDKYLKLTMDRPLNFSELGDGSSVYSVHFADIRLYTENTYFSFGGTGNWTGDGYRLELPDWVPDGEFVFLPHQSIANLRGDNGVVASQLNLITPRSEIIKASIDRPNSANDISGPSILGVETAVSEVDGNQFLSLSGTIEDASAIEHVIFKVYSDGWGSQAVFDGSDINQDGSFSFQYELENFPDPSTAKAYAVFAFDEFGNGTHEILNDRYGQISYSGNFENDNWPDSGSGSTPASFLYLDLDQEIDQALTNDMFGLSDDVSLTNYTIQPADWMAGGTGIGWLSVNSTTGELAGKIEGLNNYWQADYLAFAQDSSGNTYTAEIAILTNPFLTISFLFLNLLRC